MKRCVVAVAVAFLLISNLECHAALKIVGKQETLGFDSGNFPPKVKADYEMMKTRCVGCHTLERVVIAVTSGIGPITGQPFNRQTIKSFGCQTKRKPTPSLSKQEKDAILKLLTYLVDQVDPPKRP